MNKEKEIDRVVQTEATLEKWRTVCEHDEAIPLVMFNKSVVDKGKFHISMEDDLPKEMIVESMVGSFMAIPGFKDIFLQSIRRLLGATGDYPDGRLSSHDEGEIRLAVLVDKGRVIIDFGKETSWLGMYPEQAIKIGEALVEKGKSINN